MEDLFELEDDYPSDYPDYEETEPTEKELAHAESLVGKWCATDTKCTGFLSGLLCKVTADNNCKRGGNPAQVRIVPFRNNDMFDFYSWWLINSTDFFHVVDGGWLNPTDDRPANPEYITAYTSLFVRAVIGWVSKERYSFKYRWWDSESLPFTYLPPINSLISAVYDLGRAFKYGVYISNY